uniref:DUF4408 domain-containing protein n=1 Tax=Opuntia streptacantha TaxID=393608 RepID=A0A7C8ZXZ5_OPUST
MDNDQDDEVLVNLGASFEKESITTKSKYHKILIKTLELFLTVSALSVLLSSFTGLSYLHPYTYYFSTFLFPFQTQALQRKYVFLLCNGILVFLASMSGFWGALSSSSKTREELSVGNNAQGVMMTTEDDAEAIVLQAAAAVDPLFEEETPAGASRVETNVGFPHSRVAVAEEEEEEKKKADEQFGKDWIEDRGGLEENEEMVSRPKMIGEEGGEYDEMESEDPGSINTEELNRKIEEFIRKMKEELRLEAQQHHLIAV